jgi:hypothetical protein
MQNAEVHCIIVQDASTCMDDTTKKDYQGKNGCLKRQDAQKMHSSLAKS